MNDPIKAPAVSVIMPAYNQGAYIAQAISSVLAQTFTDWELIVIDDGSSDDTSLVVAAFSDARLRYVYQHNQERSRARNNGLALARGRYVSFLDADDFWLPAFLERHMQVMAAAPDTGLSFSGVLDVDASGQVVRRRPAHLPGDGSRLATLEALLLGNRIAVGCALISTAALVQAGGFDETMRAAEDWDLWLRLAQQHTLRCLPEPLTAYRRYNVNLVERLSTLGVVAAHQRILEKFYAGPCGPALAALAPAAWGQALWRDAWRCYALNDISAGQAMLTQARERQPEFFAAPYDEFVQSVAYLADELHDLSTPLEAALECIERLFANLPSWAGNLSPLERAAIGQYCGLHVFRAFERRQWAEVRRAAVLAVRNRPSWLANRGFRAATVRAFFPPARAA